MPTATDASALELDADAAGQDGAPVNVSSVDAALDQAIRSAEELAAECEPGEATPEFLDIDQMLAEAGAQSPPAEPPAPDAPAPDLTSIDDALAAIAKDKGDEPAETGAEEAVSAEPGADPTAPVAKTDPVLEAATPPPPPHATAEVVTSAALSAVTVEPTAVDPAAGVGPPAPAGPVPALKPAKPSRVRSLPGMALADRVVCKLESIPFKTSQTLGWASVVTAVNALAVWFVVLQRPPADQAASIIAVPAEVHEVQGAHDAGGHGAEAPKEAGGHGGGHGDESKAKKKAEPKKKPEKKGGAKKKDDGHH